MSSVWNFREQWFERLLSSEIFTESGCGVNQDIPNIGFTVHQLTFHNHLIQVEMCDQNY